MAVRATITCSACGKANRIDMARAGDHPKCGSCGTPMPLDRPVRLSDADFEILIGKLDTDASPETSRRYGIRAIPTLIAFRGGKQVAREQGAVPRSRIDALVARAGQPPGPG